MAVTGVTARWCVYTHEPIIGYRQQIGVLKVNRKPGRAAFCVSHTVSVTQTLYKLCLLVQSYPTYAPYMYVFEDVDLVHTYM